MASERFREKGRFTTKRKLEWKEHIREANKKRKIAINEYKCENIEKLQGRRIVELYMLAKEIWCASCDVPLSFRYLNNEVIVGIASIMTVRCHLCLKDYKIRTSKYKTDNLSNKDVFDVNVKSGLAILDGGIGCTHFNTVLSVLNIPTITEKLLKKCERKVGQGSLARREIFDNIKSIVFDFIQRWHCIMCKSEQSKVLTSTEAGDNFKEVEINEANSKETQSNIVESKESSNQSTKKTSEAELGASKKSVGLTMSFDAGWQKKGSGRSYDSHTGHCSGVGYRTKKVIVYSKRSKRCVRCLLGHDPSDHDCRRNHVGSSKSMESSMAVDVFCKNSVLQEEGVHLSTLIGDNDNPTLSALRRESDHSVEKWSDINHCTGQLSKALWARKLPKAVINALTYYFGCAIRTNKDDPEGVRNALSNVVPHVFDDHDGCGVWCGYKKDTKNYKHKFLPNGKGLKGEELKADLMNIFQRFVSHAPQLTPCGSSQANESFNNIVASKAPKARHYGGSESNDFRVAAAVCQKNIGTSYVSKVNENLSLSPGTHTINYRNRKDKIRSRLALLKKSIKFKKRRRALWKLKQKKTTTEERREGITYSSGCNLFAVTDFVDERIPDPIPIPVNASVCYFDLETTDKYKNCQIIEIAALAQSDQFNVYILPEQKIAPTASEVTGLQVIDGDLYLYENKVTTTPPRLAIAEFINFLESRKPVILVAHNDIRFDAPILLREIQRQGLLDEFSDSVCGFADSIPLLKKKMPDRVKEKKSFKLSILTEAFFGKNAAKDAHNAIADVAMLQNMIYHVGINNEEIKNAAISIQTILRSEVANTKAKINKSTLDCLKENVSNNMLTKMAKAGLTLEHLKKSYAEGGEQGLMILLGEDVGGKPRVTKTKPIVRRITEAIKNLVN